MIFKICFSRSHLPSQLTKQKYLEILLSQIHTLVPQNRRPSVRLHHSKHSILHKEKNKQTKYNTTDHVVDMQAVNFMLMKHNKIFLFWITIDKRFNNIQYNAHAEEWPNFQLIAAYFVNWWYYTEYLMSNTQKWMITVLLVIKQAQTRS